MLQYAMSLRRVPKVQSTTKASRSLEDVLNIGKKKAVPVSAVTRNILDHGMGVTTSHSNTDKEWKDDITRILEMFVSRGFQGIVELLQRTDNGFEPTKVSIAVELQEMSIVKDHKIVETFKPEDRGKLIEFLENHIINVLNLKIVDTVFRTFG